MGREKKKEEAKSGGFGGFGLGRTAEARWAVLRVVVDRKLFFVRDPTFLLSLEK
jgi:hypothetical protein